MEEAVPTPYDITDIPHFAPTLIELLIPVLTALLLVFIFYKIYRKRRSSRKIAVLKIDLQSFISMDHPSREDLALVLKKYRRATGTSLDEAECLLFQKDFDSTAAKELMRRLINT